MKKSATKIVTTAIVCVAIFSVTACKKNKSSSASPVPKGLLYLHITSNIDTTEIERGDTAIDANGRRIKLTVAEFYISGVTLHKADGSYVALNNAYVLKSIDDNQYFVDSVAAGNYTSVSFNLGIDATTNTTKPTSYPNTSPLSQQSPNMWFGTPQQGYVFMNIQGMVDTSASQTGTINFPISYKTGTTTMLRSIDLPAKSFTITANQAATVRIVADYGKALNNINFGTGSEATPWTNPTLATQVANNALTMFRYE